MIGRVTKDTKVNTKITGLFKKSRCYIKACFTMPFYNKQAAALIVTNQRGKGDYSRAGTYSREALIQGSTYSRNKFKFE